MTTPSPPRRTAWFLGLPRWSAEEDDRSYPHHQNNLDSNISFKNEKENEINELWKNMGSEGEEEPTKKLDESIDQLRGI